LKPKPKPRRTRDLEAGQVDQKKTQPTTTTESSPAPSKITPVPFYRTRRGIIVIAIVVIVVLGAVIGGAVGATQGKKVQAAAVPVDPGHNGGPQSATSVIPSSTKATNPQSPDPSEVADFLVPASWQGLGVPA